MIDFTTHIGCDKCSEKHDTRRYYDDEMNSTWQHIKSDIEKYEYKTVNTKKKSYLLCKKCHKEYEDSVEEILSK